MHPQPQPFQLIRSSSSLSLSLPLLGLEADLFYVHEGAINTYAMHFTVPVPADVHELEFSWQSLIAYPVSYHRLCYRSSLPFISNLICTPLTDYPTPFSLPPAAALHHQHRVCHRAGRTGHPHAEHTAQGPCAAGDRVLPGLFTLHGQCQPAIAG